MAPPQLRARRTQPARRRRADREVSGALSPDGFSGGARRSPFANRRFDISQPSTPGNRPGILILIRGAIALTFLGAGAGAFVGAAAGCAGASYDPTTSLGKQAIIDAATLQLTRQDCAGAIAQLKPLFNSINTDNNVRMTMAAADGCAANIDLFKVLGDIGTKASTIVTGGIFGFVAGEFPSVFADDIAEGAQAAEDALESVIDPGTVVLSNEMFNITSFNPGIYNVNSRVPSANAYLFFASLAAIGSIETRYDPADSGGHPTLAPPVPWTSATAVTLDGCAFGSAVVNYADSLGALAGSLPGKLGTTIGSLQTLFQTAIYAACSAGCTGGSVGPLPSNSGCALPACATCPATLRDRTSCTSLVTDPNSCAVAGIVNIIVNSGGPLGWN